MAHVLVLTANSRTTPLYLSAEVQEIRSALGEYTNFSVQHVNEVQSGDFVRLLLDHRPDILHFAGHGGSDQKILLKGRDGEAPLSSQNFAEILKQLPSAPRLLVLNACFTADFAKDLEPYVSAIVGAHGRIGDEAARFFAKTFYSVLSRSESVTRAFALAKVAAQTDGYDASMLQLMHSKASKADGLVFYARPELMASFRFDENGELSKKRTMYRMELWLRGVAQSTDSVTYQISHDLFEKKNQSFWEINRSESSKFTTDDFSSYGDVTIRAVVWSKDRGLGIELSLLDALKRHYGDSPSPKVRRALDDIEKN